MSELFIDCFDTFFGRLEIIATAKELIRIDFAHLEKRKPNTVTEQTKRWLEAYFAKEEAPLPPLAPTKTPFRQKVYEATLQVPFGQCRSYKDIAVAIGQPTAYRAVAQALRYNPYMLIVPCHRIIASKGIGGYNGGIEIKKRLLEFEGCASINL